jgi:tocopherol O-methyltransferase
MIIPKQPSYSTRYVSSVAQQVAHHYDELDPFYRALWGEHLHHGLWQRGDESAAEATRQLAITVAEHARIQEGDTVCDVGTGYGGTARLLAHRYGAQVIGLTLSMAQALYAAAQPLPAHAPRPLYLHADWLANPLPDDYFDAVIAIESTEHMADLRACFAEAWRVLRPGGRLVVCAWLARPNATDTEVRYLLEPICREGRLAGMGTAAEYQTFMQGAGFQVEQVQDVSAQVQRTWSVAIQRLLVALISDAQTWRYLLNAHRRERIFAWTVARLWLAYRSGALRYAIFTARK